MPHPSPLVCALLVSVLAACGGKSFDVDPDPNAGGSSLGGSGQGGSSAGSGRGGTASTAGVPTGGSGHAGSSQGGSPGETCAGFDDAPSAYVQVAIINKTSATIYLGQDTVTCGVSPLFRVGDAAGAVLPPPDSCSGSCQSLIDRGPIGCPNICALPSAVALQPGEVLSTSWHGLFQAQRDLPPQCVSGDYGASTCQQTMGAQPGAFVFSAVAGHSLDCKATTGGACSVCTPDGRGGCNISGALIAGQIVNAITKVQLDASYGVYGNPSAAPAPRPLPNPGGGSGDAIALRAVQLVFTE